MSKPSIEDVIKYLEKRKSYDMYDDYDCAEKAISLIKQRNSSEETKEGES